jgi:hypothetical protein
MPGPREAALGSTNRPAYKLPSRSTSYANSAPGARASTAPEPRANVSDLLQEDTATWWRRTAAREFDDNIRPRDVGTLHAEINAHPLAKKCSTTNIMGPRGGSLFTKHRYGNKRHCLCYEFVKVRGMPQSVSFAYRTDTHAIHSAGLLPDVDVEDGGGVDDFRDEGGGRLSESASSRDTQSVWGLGFRGHDFRCLHLLTILNRLY